MHLKLSSAKVAAILSRGGVGVGVGVEVGVGMGCGGVGVWGVGLVGMS